MRVLGEVGLQPLDGDADTGRGPLGRLEPLGVNVDRHDLGALLGRRYRVSTAAARQVQDPRAALDHAGMPLEPRVGHFPTARC
jgi:hypothetical protein